MYTSQPSEGLEAPFVVWWTPTPCPFFSPETKMAARMPCHHHPSSTSSSYTAMISPRSGTRKVAFSFSTSAHGSSSLSHLSLTPATDNKKVGTYTWSRTWSAVLHSHAGIHDKESVCSGLILFYSVLVIGRYLRINWEGSSAIEMRTGRWSAKGMTKAQG